MIVLNIVIKADDKLLEEMKAYYLQDIQDDANIPHTKFVVSNKDYKVIAYQTNKVMFQGKEASYQASIWQELSTSAQPVNNTVTSSIDHPLNSLKLDEYIGSDEVGTGDYFGPVVVTSAYINLNLLKQLAHLNITDSKNLTDDKIRVIAQDLKEIIPHYTYILNNEDYNQHQPTNNLNQIKAKMHNYAIGQCMKKINKKVPVVLDQFCQPKTYYAYLVNQKNIIQDIIFETKAESKYLGVAIASILARDAFLEEMDKLSNMVDTNLLKGASNKVDQQGADLVLKHGKEILTKIAKLHFENTNKINEILKNKEI